MLQMLVGENDELSSIPKHLLQFNNIVLLPKIQPQKRLGTFQTRLYTGEMPWKPCKRQKQEEVQHGGDEHTFVVPGRGTCSWPLMMHLAACATRASLSWANTARLVR